MGCDARIDQGRGCDTFSSVTVLSLRPLQTQRVRDGPEQPSVRQQPSRSQSNLGSARPRSDRGDAPTARLLKQISQTIDSDALGALVQALGALPAKLSEAQSGQVIEALLKQIGQTTSPFASSEVLGALQALTANSDRLTGEPGARCGAQADRPNDNPFALGALAQALQALPAKLSEAQASQALDPVLKQIGQTTKPLALQALAQALQALAAKLSEAQASQASKAAAASLAWAAADEEAAEWARALVTLSRPAPGRDEMLVTAIAYPAAAGSATEVLLDAIRAAHPEAPAQSEGTEAALRWLAKSYPDVLRPPVCLPPLQSDLKCPPSASQ